MYSKMRKDAFRVNIDVDDERPCLNLYGQLQYDDFPEIISNLDKAIDQYESCVSLDFSDVVDVDDIVLEKLAHNANRYREMGRKIHISGVDENIESLIDNLHLNDVFCRNSSCEGSSNCCDCELDWNMEYFSLPCDIAYCREARKRINKIAESAGFNQNSAREIMIAVGEAVTNAAIHGTTDNNDDTFSVSCLATSEKICITVRDNGPGFDPDYLPDDKDVIFEEHGRGIMCMKNLMDEVSFDFKTGTAIRMVKYNKPN